MAHRQLALLRGINVGKAKRVAMADLRALLEKLGYTEVKTLLNSGNIVFTSLNARTRAIAAQLEKEIEATLGVQARVMVLSGGELNSIVKENSLLKIMDNPSRLLVGVVNSQADLAKIESLLEQEWGNDALAIGKLASYLWCQDGILESKLLAAFSKTLKDSVTTRNWSTILKLQAML